MSRQSRLELYFQSRKGDCKEMRKRNLSLIISGTPSKSPKFDQKEVIDLCSDDESTSQSIQDNKENLNDTGREDLDSHEVSAPSTSLSHSKTTSIDDENVHMVEGDDLNAVYDILKLSGELVTPKPDKPVNHSFSDANPCYQRKDSGSDSSQGTILYSTSTTPVTPKKSPQTPSSSFQSPLSRNKYFSPSKKRSTPIKKTVRKKLGYENDEVSQTASLGSDDKTVFFLTIIDKCINNSSLWQLLEEPSQQLLLRCMNVSKPGMTIVCRLFWRKDGWHKMEKLKLICSKKKDSKNKESENDKIDDPTLHKALDSLFINGFLNSGSNENITFDEFAEILRVDEIKNICKELKLKINSKQNAITALRGYSRAKSISNYFGGKTENNASRVLKIMSTKCGPCYKLSELARKTINELYIMMYLGKYDLIRDKKLELTLLYDKIGRETFPVEEDMLDNACVVFRDRDQFERYLTAHNDYERFLAEEDLSKQCDIVTKIFDKFKNIPYGEILRCEALPTWLRRFTPMHIYTKILGSGIQYLKKDSRLDLALEVFDALISQDVCMQHKKSGWFAEKALLLHKCGRTDEAAKVLLDGFNSNMEEYSKDIMRPRAKFLANLSKANLEENVRAELLKHGTKEDTLEKNLRGVHVYKQPMDRTQSKGKLKFETRIGDERVVQDVEEFCLSHYISSGEFTNGLHCEGRLVTTMFFLLFWDIIYQKLSNCAGVFLTRFQNFPLDLFTESFYANRKQSIDSRLELIKGATTEELTQMITTTWNERPEQEVSGVTRAASCEQLCAVSECLGANGVWAICSRLAMHYRHAHSGFPDLTLWNTETKKVRFVEVKSDTDHPSIKQIQWLHYLQKHGVDAEFCYVGVHTTRCKARSSHASQPELPTNIE